MRPILFQIGGTYIWSHQVFVALGLVAALTVSWRIARDRGRADQQLLWIIAGGLVGAAILAKFGLAIRYFQQADEPTLGGLFRSTGRTVLGGLAGGYAGVVLTKRFIGYRRATGDLFAPGVALGMAIGRIGCFLAERPGTVTTVPWAVRVPTDAAPRISRCPECLTGAPMHPSFIYEIAFLGLAAWLLFASSRRRVPPLPWMGEGDQFKLFLLAYAVFRFFVEFVRGNPIMAFGLSGSQLMLLPSSIVLALYFIRRRQRAFAPLVVASS
jgi:phosphatidylglycerol---prolipoprotein diacylglyceryl transferase